MPLIHTTKGDPMTRLEHLLNDFHIKPRELAKHLREVHGVEPKNARKGYEREVWHSQHEYETEHKPDIWLTYSGNRIVPVAARKPSWQRMRR